MMAELRKRWLLIVCIAAGVLAYSALVRLSRLHGTLLGTVTPQTIGWYWVAFAAYVVAIWRVEKQPRRVLAWIWATAILYRALLLFTTPTLSTDVYRYLWDGHIANNGVSPFALPIDSPELDYLDTPVRALANHTWMASPYLPAAQWLFAGLTRWFPLHPFVMQMAMVLVDLGAGLLIAGLLRISALPSQRVILYLWNPLVVVETAHGAHIDAWMVLLTLLALWLTFQVDRHAADRAPNPPRLWQAVTRWAAPLSLALATLTKLLPALLLPVLFWRWRWWQLLLYALATVGLLLPSGLRAGWGLRGPLDGRGLFAALRIYGDRWNFNSGLFRWLEVSLTSPFPVGMNELDANLWAKRTAALLLLATLLLVWRRARLQSEPRALLRLMAVPLMAYLLLTPTVHPWYALIVLAFVPFLTPAEGERSRQWLFVAPWLYLSAVLVLSYLTYLDPHNLREVEWVRRVEWLPTMALLALAIFGSRPTKQKAVVKIS